jgi:hypothetical protein
MTVIEEEKILNVVLDPRWKVGKIRFDGSEHIFITMQHPEHLNITWLVPREQAAKMGRALIDLAAQPEAFRP